MLSRLTVLLGLLCLAPPLAEPVSAQTAPVSVVELFTSQGCSSCPAADALLKTYAERSDVVALSLPVDYWDYLGWKDTLASPKFTSRQRAYANARGDGEVYTPQAVVNGTAHVIGSQREAIEAALGQTRHRLEHSRVALGVRSDGGKVTIDVGAASGSAKATTGTLWLIAVQPKVDVDIKSGENRGRKLSYYNVVRELTPVGAWSGKSARLELPQGAMLRAGERCAVVLQAESGGPVIAAAWMAPSR